MTSKFVLKKKKKTQKLCRQSALTSAHLQSFP